LACGQPLDAQVVLAEEEDGNPVDPRHPHGQPAARRTTDDRPAEQRAGQRAVRDSEVPAQKGA
jgi:hypothetical protein